MFEKHLSSMSERGSLKTLLTDILRDADEPLTVAKLASLASNRRHKKVHVSATTRAVVTNDTLFFKLSTYVCLREWGDDVYLRFIDKVKGVTS